MVKITVCSISVTASIINIKKNKGKFKLLVPICFTPSNNDNIIISTITQGTSNIVGIGNLIKGR